jgi:hypothetical protein
MGPRLDVGAGGGVRAHGQAPTDEGGRILIFPRHVLSLGKRWRERPRLWRWAICTWEASGRGGMGRDGLCWGVDDFDEAYPLPYTNGSPGGQCQGHDRFG